MTPVRPQFFRQALKMSLEMTSSFFWSSPWTFCSPARPVAPCEKKRESVRWLKVSGGWQMLSPVRVANRGVQLRLA